MIREYQRKKSTIPLLYGGNRIILGLVFIFSGGVKAIDPIGTQYKIEDYFQAFSESIPLFSSLFSFLSSFALLLAFLLIATEFVLGVGLVFNVLPKLTAMVTFIFYAVMLPLTLYIALTNPISDCGCFGDAFVLSNWQTFYKNVVLTSLAVLNLYSIKKTQAPQNISFGLMFLVSSYIILFGFMFWTIRHLPLVDFRPFKKGNDIVTLMEYPDGAEPDKYEITLIYERNGIQQEFSIQDYPKGDSSWTFVDQNSVLVKKGYEPPIHDFELLNLNYDDLTSDILSSQEPVTLVIMYSLDKCDLSQMTKLTDIYRNCIELNRSFYIVTGANQTQIEQFCTKTTSICENKDVCPFSHPADIFLMCDPITLKTIVRANPGVIIIQNGVIQDKYNVNNIKI